MSQVQTPSTAKRVDVIASLSMESMLRALELPVDFRFASEQVSMETSQQLQEAERLELQTTHHENMQKLLKSDKPTGTPHLFVLDAEKLAVGDLDAQSTLQAFANHYFSNSNHAAVAMISPNKGYTASGKAAADLVKETVLAGTGTVALESIESLKVWLNIE